MLWIISWLSGSGWFWVFLIALPVYTIISILNEGKKYDPDNLGQWWISGIIILLLFFFVIPFGVSLWSLIIFLYILALIIAYGATFSPKTPKLFLVVPGIIVGIIITTIIGQLIQRKQITTPISTQSGATIPSAWGPK
jgi:hypothetical protein